MKNHAVALGLVLVMAMVVSASSYTVSTTISAPTDEGGTDVVVSSGDANDVVLTVTSTGSLFNIAGDVKIGTGTGSGMAKLVVDGGTVGDAASPETLAIGYTGSEGMLEIKNGGTVHANYVRLGRAGAYAGHVNISGGALNINSQLQMGYSSSATGVSTFTQSGGTTATNGHVYIGYNAPGAMTLSGGTVDFGTQVRVGYNSTAGRLDVIGSGATILANRTMSTTNRFYVYGTALSTLGFTLTADAGNISCIDAYYTQLGSGATVDMALSGFTPVDGQVFDLLKDWDGAISISTLVLSAEDTTLWTLQTNVAGDTLQAKYTAIPEPATMALLGIGLVGIVARRRRKD